MSDLPNCAACGKPLTARAKPRWAFTLDEHRRLVGLMHTNCVFGRGGKYDAVLAEGTTADEARFIAWTSVADQGTPNSARRFAVIMAWATPPSLQPGVLSAQQELWLERIAAQDHDAIRAAYDQLLADYRAWLEAEGAN